MALNEYGVKLDSNGYAPSILNQQPTCLICGRYHTARHEVFYGPYRDKSKRLGLWANLCPWCHQNGPNAIHEPRVCRNCVANALWPVVARGRGVPDADR